MNFKYICIFGNSLYALAFQKHQGRHHAPRCKMLVLQAHPVSSARSEFWGGWQAVSLGGGVTVMEERGILAGG